MPGKDLRHARIGSKKPCEEAHLNTDRLARLLPHVDQEALITCKLFERSGKQGTLPGLHIRANEMLDRVHHFARAGRRLQAVHGRLIHP